MDLELTGRVALVTGASVGIGRGIARALAAEGAQLAVVARRAALLDTLADEVVAAGGLKPLCLAVDLTSPGSTDRIRDAVLGAFGRFDILVNVAGGSTPMPVDSPEEKWEAAFALNFTAHRHLAHAFLPSMQQQRWGRIINVTGHLEPLGMNAAVVAKSSVHMWAKMLSQELGPFGITVNCLSPGWIMSEQVLTRTHPTVEDRERRAKTIPLGYLGEPHDLGHLAAFLASPKARYISGEIIHVDGGFRHFAF